MPPAAYRPTVYRQALAGLIDAGQRYRRLDPRRQLIVVDGGDARRAHPLLRLCLAARRLHAAHFHRASWRVREIAHHYASPGVGLPLVGERIAACPERNLLSTVGNRLP